MSTLLHGETRASIQARQWAAEVASPRAYRPDVDGLRAIAAMSVVLWHAGWPRGGAYGVDVFFVISGFLISSIILRELEIDSFSLVGFYTRRVRRIFPALLVLLLGAWLLGILFLHSHEYLQLCYDIAASAAFAENFALYAYPTTERPLSELLISHLWTLGIEEQFYLLWPLLLMMAWRVRAIFAAVLVAALALSASSFAATLFVDRMAAWLMPWNRFWELGMGAVLAHAMRRYPDRSSWLRKVPLIRKITADHIGLLGAACLAVSLCRLSDSAVLLTVLATTGSLLSIAAGPVSVCNRHILSKRVLVFLGLLSYPIYLWHYPLLTMADVLYSGTSAGDRAHAPMLAKIGAIAATLLLAYITYTKVEQPLRLSKRGGRVALLLCGAMLVCGIAPYLISMLF
jgi:peptidoglycan/LPS O-acetylase OafA/YrhL